MKVCVKRWRSVLAMMIVMVTTAKAQQPKISQQIDPVVIGVSDHMTTNLIFPSQIKSIDRGRRDLLVQKAIDVDNVLQVKLQSGDFKETNLTVITNDARLYSFRVRYEPNPAMLNMILGSNNAGMEVPVLFSASAGPAASLENVAARAASAGSFLRHPKDVRYQMGIRLKGIYIHDDHLFFKLQLSNTSALDYDVDQFRFFIRDAKQSKRTSSQELELKPDVVHGPIKDIPGRATQVCVFGIPRFSIPDQKQLIVQLMEKEGGRHLQLWIRNKHLLKVKEMNIR
ncbi:conjugative transposon protein TraN [Chitinophaga horti]|uniref:Conjugative transposon protein TraN n=1 Tax=Chitinophaga horti TaxID=2920382 RepID=A0ABY6IXN9_9BACT|nr:conjugative transposon protein TraN [Chitinophaga horti]UYQ92148.1 conjugative transposon protein TraN [Chitinophaga horti]